ncbi:hypothetical protein THICB350010 [Thiomonas sp. CB3]|nr:hypothetical protein THICB350010 [Thiomonas sp. CB3]
MACCCCAVQMVEGSAGFHCKTQVGDLFPVFIGCCMKRWLTVPVFVPFFRTYDLALVKGVLIPPFIQGGGFLHSRNYLYSGFNDFEPFLGLRQSVQQLSRIAWLIPLPRLQAHSKATRAPPL